MDYRARFFSPSLGRFLQPDAIIPNPVNPQSWNRYSYVTNRPINFNDPTGHYECEDAYECDGPGDDNAESGVDDGGDDSESDNGNNDGNPELFTAKENDNYIIGYVETKKAGFTYRYDLRFSCLEGVYTTNDGKVCTKLRLYHLDYVRAERFERAMQDQLLEDPVINFFQTISGILNPADTAVDLFKSAFDLSSSNYYDHLHDAAQDSNLAARLSNRGVSQPMTVGVFSSPIKTNFDTGKETAGIGTGALLISSNGSFPQVVTVSDTNVLFNVISALDDIVK